MQKTQTQASREENMESPDDQLNDIAVIGLAGRFPKARNVHEFWRNMRDGFESVSFFTDEELLQLGISPEFLQLPNCVKARAILDDIDQFDAPLFGFTPREAEITDPQHRLFLECAWEALEDAGYDPGAYPGKIGVYAGAGLSGYFAVVLSNRDVFRSIGLYRTIIGNDKDFLSTLVSYKLDLKGPSVVVQTACSTSLVAVHLACQSLLNGECDMALAGGVSIRLPQKSPYLFQEGNILSPDGHCRAFDADAQGTIGGEGVAIVVVKRFADALRDRDDIRAVIKASAINNDGASKVSFTAPSIGGQAEVITEALDLAGVGPETISYIEAHGTGTVLGDPIEVAALTRAFSARTVQKGFCAIGSVKANIGHLDAAAGVAGLIKLVLALSHKMIPPTLHFKRANPKIDFKNSPFYVQTSLTEWISQFPRRAGVSSFGIGGTNAHVILEEASPRGPSGKSRPWQLIVLSAKTSSVLEKITENITQYLDERSDIDLADVAYTLQVGRRALEHRRMMICKDRLDALKVLNARDPKRLITAFDKPGFRPVMFMFPGQGTQYVNMTLDLYRHEPYFRDLVDLCAESLKPSLGLDLCDVLYPTEEAIEDARHKLSQTQITQPALFVVEYSLARLWMHWGIRPEAMIGHSLGEYVAACLAGVFTLQEALALVAARGQLMGEMPEGRMLAVRLSEESLLPLLNGDLALAAVNSPTQCVVAGPPEAIAEFQKRLDEKSIRWNLLQTSHALHSQIMDPILDSFTKYVEKVKLKPPSIRFESNVTGTWITATDACDANYWAKHLRQTALFAPGVRELLREPDAILLEVGPGQTLCALAAQQMDMSGRQAVFASLPPLRNQDDALGSVLHTLGSLWLAGIPVEWSRFHHGAQRHRIALPLYPFERKRYWVQASNNGSAILSDDHAQRNTQDQTSQVEKNDQIFSVIKQPETIMSKQANILSATSARRDAILAMLHSIVYELTGAETGEKDVHINFFDLGVDSLLIIQFTQAVQDRCGLKIPYRLLFEEVNTLDAVTGYLDRELPLEVFSTEPVVERSTPASPKPNPLTAASVQTVAHTAETQPGQRPSITPALPDELAPESGGLVATSLPSPFRDRAAAHPRLSHEFGPGDTIPLVRENRLELPAGSDLKDLYSHQLRIISQQLDIMQGMNPDTLTNEFWERQRSRRIALPVDGATGDEASVSIAIGARKQDQLQTAVNDGSTSAPVITPSLSAEQESFLPHKPLEINTTRELSSRQKKYLDEFINRYVERTLQSKRIAQDSRRSLADSRLSVGFSLLLKELIYPIYGQRAAGSRVWDVDGNEYVDISMGYGVNLFGNSPPFITQSIEEQLRQGIALAPQLELTGKVAELVCELTGVERVNFCNSGTEAVMGALRAARTKTRRCRIAMFTGSYHGWSDGTLARPLNLHGGIRSFPGAPGVDPKSVEDIIVLDYGLPQSLDILKAHAHELAAVLVEPVQSRRPDLQPREFLHELRELTARSETALIFDEMITGFRTHPGGAQAWFGVQADLVTYGKVIGGGMPIGLVAGKAVFMDAFDGGRWDFGDASFPPADKTFFAAAFFKHPLSMAAAWAVLNHLKESGPTLQEELNRRTAEMAETLNEYFKRAAAPIRVVYFGSLFRFVFGRELKHSELFIFHLIHKGIFTWEGGNFYLSTAHSEADVKTIIRAVIDTVEDLRGGDFLPDLPESLGGSQYNERQESLQSGAQGQAKANQIGEESRPPASVQPVACHLKADLEKRKPIQFSLYYFGNHELEFRDNKYDLIFKGAKFADEHGFSAVWIPERHFDSFGGFSPNPSVLAAALARETERLHIRAGSVVLPLHNPILVAEEWAMVDNLSKGRVGISFASGWHPNDFVFAPDSYANRRDVMHEGIEIVRRLWRGESLSLKGGGSDSVNVRLAPMPMQPELPFWLTVASPRSSLKAGQMGAGILTNFMGQTFKEVAEKIALYRESVTKLHGPGMGHVTVQLHTFLSDDLEKARQKVQKPLYDYFKASFALKNEKVRGDGHQIDLDRLSPEDLQYVFSDAYKHYVQDVGLIGTPDYCSTIVDRLIEIGVDEICCLIDFGVDIESVLESLHYTNELRKRYEKPSEPRLDMEGLPGRVQEGRQESIRLRHVDPGSQTDSQTASPERSDRAIEYTTDEVLRMPMTEGQKHLWALSQLGDHINSGYNESIRLDLRGQLDVEAMLWALQDIVDRHQALRITFSPHGEHQYVHPSVKAQVPMLDLSHLGKPEGDGELDAWLTAEMSKPFNLAQAPLFRFRLARLEPEHHVLLVTYHHAIADGRSVSVFVNDLKALYTAHCRSEACQLPIPQQFSDYIIRQSRQPSDATLDKNQAYWMKIFEGDWPFLKLPADRPQPSLQTFKRSRYQATLGAPISAEIRDFCKDKRCTTFLMMLVALKLLLNKLTGQSDIIVGISTADSESVYHKDLIGFRLNQLALRSQINGDPTFSEFLSYVKGLMWDAYEHQDFSITELYKNLKLRRQPGKPSPVSIGFNLDHKGTPLEFYQLTVQVTGYPTYAPTLDIYLDVSEGMEEFLFRWNYNPELFDERTIQRWMKFFETLLIAIIDDPESRLSALPAFISQPVFVPESPEPRQEHLEPRKKQLDEEDDDSNLTRYQLLIWVAQKLDPSAPMNTHAGFLLVPAPVDHEHFQRVVAILVKNSDALRTIIREKAGAPYQQVIADVDCAVEYHDFTHFCDPLGELRRWGVRHCQAPFDLEKRPFEFALIKLSDGEYGIYISLSHLIADARSFQITQRLLSEYYRRSIDGQLEETTALPSFQDYVRREREYLRTPRALESEAYWKEKLAETVEPISLYGRSPLKRNARVARASSDLGPERTRKLQQVAEEQDIFAISMNVTMFSALAAILCAYIYRVSGSRAVSLGVPFHNRRSNKETIGLFMLIFPVRVVIDSDESFISLITKFRAEFFKALRHSEYPVGNALQKQAYDVEFNFIDALFPYEFNGAPIRQEWIHSGYGNESLMIQVRKGASGSLIFDLDAHCDIFDDSQREQALQHLMRVVDGFLKDRTQLLQYVEILTPEERKWILEDFNRTERPFAHQQSFSRLFEAQVRRSPDGVAVIVDGQSLTYARLNSRANGLASYLRTVGIGPDMVAPLLARRGIDFLIAMLAIFKAGAAYLPLDPLAPRQRLAQILNQSASPWVLVAGDCLTELLDTRDLLNLDTSTQILQIDDLLSTSRDEQDLPCDSLPRNLSYVIYTSGSTGLPKGAMVEQEGMINHLFVKIADLRIDDESIIAQTAPQSFDISVWQFLAALLVGGRVHIVDDDECRDPSGLLRIVEREGITIWETVPVLLRAALDQETMTGGARFDLSSLRWLLVTGEALAPDLCRQWLERHPSIPLLNAYGPTECSDDVTHHTIGEMPETAVSRIPIGCPVANIQIYILDENLLPTPVGVAGEVCVGGIGVGRGYLNDAYRTARVFIPNQYGSEPGERLYRTGDLGRHLADATIEFLGRIDRQVKIRGYRIELGEIETHLRRHPAVYEAVVMARDVAPSDKRLIAYLAPRQSQTITVGDLRSYLQERLPDFMVPSAYVMLDALPLTANGKVDWQRLPLPSAERPQIDGAFVVPSTPVERTLARIWRKVLRLERIGVNDNFFELGGDSILAVHIAARANRAGLRFAPMDIFERQTIADLADLINLRSSVPATRNL